MTYATQNDLETRRPNEWERSAPENPGGSVSVDAVNAALQFADNLINEKLGKRYVVPFRPAPPAIVDLAIDIAFYDMSTGEKATEGKTIRYQAALKRLQALADGQDDLPGAATVSESTRTHFQSDPRRFTRQRLNRLL